MLKVINVLKEKDKTVGANVIYNGKLYKWSIQQLASLTDKTCVNAIIDKNGFVRAKEGGYIPRVSSDFNYNTANKKDISEVTKLLAANIINLYHGTNNPELIPMYGKGKSNTDYGKGFYTTPNLDLAKEWALSTYNQSNIGYVYNYNLNIEGLNILDLTSTNLVHWVAELLSNRYVNSGLTDLNKDVIKLFIRKYKLNTRNYDIIIGYRADDRYFNYTEQFVNNTITIETLETVMRTGLFGLQVFIKSKRAFSRLQQVGDKIKVSKEYRDRYSNRESNATRECNKIIKRNVLNSGNHILDLVRS